MTKKNDDGCEDEPTNLIINYLPLKLQEQDLMRIFGKAGVVSSVRIMRNHEQKSKGFGFVKYTSHKEALRAIDEFNGFPIMGKKLKVTFSRPGGRRDRCNLFVSNLPKKWTNQELSKVFQKYGPLLECRVLRNNKNRESRRCGFVRLNDQRNAARAIKERNNWVPPGCFNPIVVKEASLKNNQEEEITPAPSEKKEEIKEEKVLQIDDTPPVPPRRPSQGNPMLTQKNDPPQALQQNELLNLAFQNYLPQIMPSRLNQSLGFASSSTPPSMGFSDILMFPSNPIFHTDPSQISSMSNVFPNVSATIPNTPIGTTPHFNYNLADYTPTAFQDAPETLTEKKITSTDNVDFNFTSTDNVDFNLSEFDNEARDNDVRNSSRDTNDMRNSSRSYSEDRESREFSILRTPSPPSVGNELQMEGLCTIFIANLPEYFTRWDIKFMCDLYGDVQRIQERDEPGIVFVLFDSIESANEAADRLDGSWVFEKKIHARLTSTSPSIHL